MAGFARRAFQSGNYFLTALDPLEQKINSLAFGIELALSKGE
jgi:hypothetical protein